MLEVPANLLLGKSNPCNGLASTSIQFFIDTTGYLNAFCKVKYWKYYTLPSRESGETRCRHDDLSQEVWVSWPDADFV